MTPQESGKVWPCGDIYWTGLKWKYGLIVPPKVNTRDVYEYEMFCMICGAKRPEEEKDELDEIMEKSDWTGLSYHALLTLKKELRAWKEKDRGNFCKHVTMTACGLCEREKEEKPKRLSTAMQRWI